ncbi:MAG: GNAT family N-acetyltransferase [Bacteroidales bacterium]|jgi:diamine N-acetyltransferase|nr:GNAT family N-acetyltransferase [Bacteroidales bacterium]
MRKITLRPIEPSDVDLLYKWENDPKIMKVSHNLTPFSKHILTEYINSAHQDIYTVKQLRLIIEIAETKRAIGTIDLFDFDPQHKRAGIGILIDEDFQNQGYGFQTLEEIKDYSKNTLGLHQLYCNIAINNKNSISLFEKSGFVQCGLKKDWLLIDNQWIDEIKLQLIFQ